MQGGGAERVAALLCNHWVEQGHDVTLMPTFSGRGECYYALNTKVKLDFLADRIAKKRWPVFERLWRLNALRQMIRRSNPDVVVSFLTHVNVAALLAGCGCKIPVVVSERVYPPAYQLSFFYQQMRKRLYPTAHAVVVQSEDTLNWLSENIPAARGVVIANPVLLPDEKQRTPASGFLVHEQKRFLLAVGRLEHQKGFDVLIQAFAEIASLQIEWHLVIVGEGSERKKLEQLVGQLGLDDRISLPGRTDNVSDWYQQADLFVLSSRFEGFPNALLEAMANGVPAVSFDCQTGPSDIIQNGVNGMLVAPENGAFGLAKALSSLMTDASLREKLGQQATYVRERYAIEKIAAQWDKVMFGYRP